MDWLSILGSPSFLMIAGVLVLLVIAGTFLRRSAPPVPVVSQPVLTDAEIAFHRKLTQAVSRVGGLAVYPQMAMSAFLRPRPGLDRNTHMATFRRFSQKRPDFVLVDSAWRVRLIVELDDSTHDARKDKDRDHLTGSAGIKTVRFMNARRTSVDEIHGRLSEALSS